MQKLCFLFLLLYPLWFVDLEKEELLDVFIGIALKRGGDSSRNFVVSELLFL